MTKNKQQENNVIILLRVCTFLLAATSFWATAQGMIEYTFPEEWQAYAASLGIQGLLLGLNFALPYFLEQSKKILQKVSLLVLTFVVLFCSSWFSYLYIAGQAYGNSWETECRLLAQSVFRNELFAADVYTKLCGEELQQDLVEQSGELYQQAAETDEKKFDVTENLNWNEENTEYGAENFAAKDIMLPVIGVMEKATAENASQDAREQAISVLAGAKTNLEKELEGFKGRISELDDRITAATASLASAQNRLQNAPDGVDLTPYREAVNSATQTYEYYFAEQNKLEGQRSDFELALRRINHYSTILGMAEESDSSYSVDTQLREIQRELFEASPDSDMMLHIAAEILSSLQNAADLESGTGDALNYRNFLPVMNSFVQNLEDYSTIKDARNDIQEQIDMLSDGSILMLDAEEEWRAVWKQQFSELKSIIGGLPVYALQDSSIEVAMSFDRAESMEKLDEVIRRYLTEHNAVQDGLIYLMSPYRGVAIFSLVLAFLLDIAAFITGIIISRVSKKDKEDGTDIIVADFQDESIEMHHETKWEVIPGLNRYIFLTGDYMFIDGIMTYNAIENGEETEIEYADKGMQSDFYLWKDKRLCAVEQTLLLFKGTTDGPQDGVYIDCVLHYADSLLTMTQSGKTAFLGTIEPHIPVYQLSTEQYEVLPVKRISDIHGQKVVISLNKEGTRIIALYVIQ